MAVELELEPQKASCEFVLIRVPQGIFRLLRPDHFVVLLCRSILYLSTICDDDAQGKVSLHTAIKALLTCSTSESHERTTSIQKETVEEAPPILLWSALYIQQLTKVCS